MTGRSFKTMICALAALVAILLAGPSDVVAQEYLLKPGDVIEITVLEDPNLNRRVLVGPDGKIALPLAGTIQAGERSLAQVQSTIRARLSGQFVNPPSVTASLVALGPPEPVTAEEEEEEEEDDSAAFYVLGEVQNPGRYNRKIDDEITVLQALAIAGGPGVFAARSRIQIRIPGEETDEVLIFDYDAIEQKAAPEARMLLEDGVVIVVPERGFFE